MMLDKGEIIDICQKLITISGKVNMRAERLITRLSRMTKKDGRKAKILSKMSFK
jgi:hypothetical protein